MRSIFFASLGRLPSALRNVRPGANWFSSDSSFAASACNGSAAASAAVLLFSASWRVQSEQRARPRKHQVVWLLYAVLYSTNNLVRRTVVRRANTTLIRTCSAAIVYSPCS
jgi:hypothetical protein